jgi:hypothetical protein
MGPYPQAAWDRPDPSEIDREIDAIMLANPEVSIHGPNETKSGLWEVSLPERATIAFDSPGLMLRVLSGLYPEKPDGHQ